MQTEEKYDKSFNGRIDIYRICRLYNIEDPALFHAIKKLLRCGDGEKSKNVDVSEAILSLQRYLEMEEEDGEYQFDEIAEEIAESYRDDVYSKLHQVKELDKSVALQIIHDIVGDDVDISFFADNATPLEIDEALYRCEQFLEGKKKVISPLTKRILDLNQPRYKQFFNAIRSQKQVKIDAPPSPEEEEISEDTIDEWVNSLVKEEIEQVKDLLDWHEKK